jgi:CubicO group peptidase (beta-lactamase class C family)
MCRPKEQRWKRRPRRVADAIATRAPASIEALTGPPVDADRTTIYDAVMSDSGQGELTRRELLGAAVAFGLSAGILGRALPARAAPTGTPTPNEQAAMAQLVQSFMSKYNVPGLSIAIAEHGTPVYSKAFGVAETTGNTTLTTDHRFRIASVSKPITSTAIFQLIEKHKLSLNDHVFGPGAVLGTTYGRPPYKKWVSDIRIWHLLTHTCGGWANTGITSDPMFLNPRMNHKQLIHWTLANLPLHHRPGTSFAYSNFGYCVLGRVIEKLTGKPYDVSVRKSVLGPCGITDMEIAGNTLAERKPGEVVYYSQDNDSPYSMNVRRMDSHGGWIARPIDLVRFLTHVDGFSPHQLLRQWQVMTTPTTANPNYAKGWQVNRYDNWWHGGSLPGTATEIVRTHSWFCWAIFTNTLVPNSDMFFSDLDSLPWNMAHQVKSWQL